MTGSRSIGRFLSDRQRKYLSGEYQPETKNKERVLRFKIRSRVEGALFEFQILNDGISEKDLGLIFSEFESDIPQGGGGEIYNITMPEQTAGVSSILSMAYRGYRTHNMDSEEFTKSILENALIKAESDRTDVSRNNVSADLELHELKAHPEPENLDPVEKWEKNLPLTREEQEQLYERVSDKVDRKVSLSEVGELIEEHLIDPQADGEQ
jgi:hypothetical protein